MIKAATFNIWNDDATFALREKDILRELSGSDADIIALQEVPAAFAKGALLAQYPQLLFMQYEAEEEGLALISRYPVLHSASLPAKAEENCFAQFVVLQTGETELAVMNVHLTWHSDAERQNAARRYAAFLAAQPQQHKLFLGDFNCPPDSAVHRGLLRQGWRELCCEWAEKTEQPLFATLDFHRNPRWKNETAHEAPQNFDRIYLQGEAQLTELFMFGTAVNAGGYSASDHYGVCAGFCFHKQLN